MLTGYCPVHCDNETEWKFTMFWRRKPAYVEWDLVGSDARGFGADIYLAAAPMVIVHQIEAKYPTYDDVAASVEEWVGEVPEKYRLNQSLEAFKALAHELGEDDASPSS
jgi:hypothetical protein